MRPAQEPKVVAETVAAVEPVAAADVAAMAAVKLEAGVQRKDPRAVVQFAHAHEAGVGSIPVSAFYAREPERGYLRLCFAKRPDTLDEAVSRLCRFRANF